MRFVVCTKREMSTVRITCEPSPSKMSTVITSPEKRTGVALVSATRTTVPSGLGAGAGDICEIHPYVPHLEIEQSCRLFA
jgi:hypothetical protein